MTDARPWLAEMISRYGEPRIQPGPVTLTDGSGSYERECWVWFPGGRNVNLALDRYPQHWMIRATGDGRRADVWLSCQAAPDDSLIRTVLVVAGLLDAGPDRWAELADWLGTTADEAAEDARAWGAQAGSARQVRTETLGQVRARMDEIERGR